MRYAVLGCALTLAAVFAVSAGSKLAGRSAFAAFVASTGRLLPDPRLSPALVAFGVVTAELAVPPLLVAAPAVGLGLAAALLLSFSVGVLVAVRRGVQAPCRCFGASAARLNRFHALRSGALAVFAVVGAAMAVPLRGAGWVVQLHPGGIAVTILCAAVLALLVFFFDDIAALFASTPAMTGRTGVPERS
jgi:hypothetical protein